MFAPVGRGTPGHPDRDRQRHQHPQDRSDARPQRLDGRQGDQTQHVVPVQRERVLPAVPAVPAETAEDGPVDGQILHPRPRRGARPAAGAPNRASATTCHANACGRGWPNGCVAAGRRRPSAAGRASCSPTTPPCACARRPSTVGSTPTAIAVNAGRAAFHAATGGGAGVMAGGRRVSRFPDGFPSPSVRRRPATAAVSAIGRPTA
ncbi:IS30 family transposase [Bifidobacterium longum subsp. infantis]|nr:IS30 family transposase [Bifidobacterium longum subsp. infantis]